jgi:hypothetical protein
MSGHHAQSLVSCTRAEASVHTVTRKAPERTPSFPGLGFWVGRQAPREAVGCILQPLPCFSFTQSCLVQERDSTDFGREEPGMERSYIFHLSCSQSIFCANTVGVRFAPDDERNIVMSPGHLQCHSLRCRPPQLL